MPTLIGKPCPSDPVDASTPGTFSRSGCPPSALSRGRETLQVGRGEEPLLREHGVERERGVTLAENETVAILAPGVCGIHAQDPVVEHPQDLEDAERARNVPFVRGDRRENDLTPQLLQDLFDLGPPSVAAATVRPWPGALAASIADASRRRTAARTAAGAPRAIVACRSQNLSTGSAPRTSVGCVESGRLRRRSDRALPFHTGP